MKLLLIKLEGALQSFGEWAKWDTRDSAKVPTKSAVIGLIACCMGIPRYDERINELHKKLQFAVRNDRPGSMMTDFHTVQSDKMRTADDKEQNRTIVSRRKYIMDCAFMVALGVNDATNQNILDSCATALKSPVWTPYLGRKSCVPSSPLFYDVTEEYSSAKDALLHIPLISREGEKPHQVLIMYECPEGGTRHNDNLVDATQRIFFPNRYDVISLNNHDTQKEENICIDHS